MRIVSLLPAATEIAFALGLGDDVVGITHACDYPPETTDRPVVTAPATVRAAGPAALEPSAFALDLGALVGLAPDLVLVPGRPGAPLAGPPPAVVAREALGPQVSIVTLAPTSLEGILHAISTVGAMTAAEDEALGLVEILRERLADVEETVAERRAAGVRSPRVVALEWLDPPFAAGRWFPEQVRRAGGWELLGSEGEPPLATSWDALGDVDPEVILLAPAGLHLRATLDAVRRAPRPGSWSRLRAVREGRVFALDGAAFVGRPGPRVIDGIELLAELFDPDAFVDVAPSDGWRPVEG